MSWRFFTKEGAEKSVSGTQSDRGTTFPTSPADGQEYTYIADATNGVEWRFKYNAGSASSFKWEFVGGSPLMAQTGTQSTLGSAATFVDASASVTLPRNGDYIFTLNVGIQSSAVGASQMSAIFADGANAQIGSNVALNLTAASLRGNLFTTQFFTGRTASSVAKVRVLGSSASDLMDTRIIYVTPIRVS